MYSEYVTAGSLLYIHIWTQIHSNLYLKIMSYIQSLPGRGDTRCEGSVGEVSTQKRRLEGSGLTSGELEKYRRRNGTNLCSGCWA